MNSDPECRPISLSSRDHLDVDRNQLRSFSNLESRHANMIVNLMFPKTVGSSVLWGQDERCGELTTIKAVLRLMHIILGRAGSAARGLH